MKKELFRAGTWTDASGKTHTFTGDQVKGIARTFSNVTKLNSKGNAVPIVPGHPKGDTPALAWLEKVWTEGEGTATRLFGEIGEIADKAQDLIGKAWKNVSISLSEGVLRHVGLTNFPAVEGLTAFKFNDSGDFETFNFHDSFDIRGIGKVLQSMRDWLIEVEGMEKADDIIPQWRVDDLKNATDDDPEAMPAFTDILNKIKTNFSQNGGNTMPTIEELQAEVNTLKGKITGLETDMAAEKEKVNTLTAERDDFEKKFNDSDKAHQELVAQMEKDEETRLDKEDWDLVEAMIKERRIAPAKKEEELYNLKLRRGQGDFEFTDEKTKQKVKQPAREHYMESLKKNPQFPENQNFDDGKEPAPRTTTDTLREKVQEKLKADPSLSFSQASQQVLEENPDLNQDGEHNFSSQEG